MMTALIIGLVIAAVFIGQAYRIVVAYRAATGTPWQRFLAAFSDSLTIALSRAMSLGAAAVAWGINALPSLDPSTSIGAALTAVLKPQWVPYYALGFALLIEIARRRGGSIDPITPPKG